MRSLGDQRADSEDLKVALTSQFITQVEQFLYREARLLDAERYREWLSLLADDIHYWMPGVENRQRRDPMPDHSAHGQAVFDSTKADLEQLVEVFENPTMTGEGVRIRHMHVVNNVLVEPTANPSEFTVFSILQYRQVCGEEFEAQIPAHREDVLRRVQGDLRIARRKILAQDSILPSEINTFL
ncbi:aromatic-ring-hydroxylating dioxygenase subunit beta [Streptomyces rhizosphaericus]|uniref:aromatic-ring-hydroxylating dioxygenase subunit beta n=1 Tax=Streptomyces rhizosphaericus TaxID=114699 RepID=UPI000A35FD87|nr:aromatic-ring-hydroxylating dioxygenase subunit beta [Streptomyces rhizosphaericus]